MCVCVCVCPSLCLCVSPSVGYMMDGLFLILYPLWCVICWRQCSIVPLSQTVPFTLNGTHNVLLFNPLLSCRLFRILFHSHSPVIPFLSFYSLYIFIHVHVCIPHSRLKSRSIYQEETVETDNSKWVHITVDWTSLTLESNESVRM